MTEQKREFKGIWIPKEIWLHKELKPSEKILLAEIDSFEKAKGCFATNNYFGIFLGVSSSRASQMISKLHNLELITIKLIYKINTKQVDKRIIKVNKNTLFGT